jgi:UPF0716 protein FxsA
MNVAKCLLFALLALPFAELAVFIIVIVAVGLLAAVALQAASSLAGLMVLRLAGGAHISRVRAALNSGRVTALSTDGTGSLTLLAGILMLIPGFITDLIGFVLLVGTFFRRALQAAADDGVIDLPPEQWRQIDDQRLTDRRDDTRKP